MFRADAAILVASAAIGATGEDLFFEQLTADGTKAVFQIALGDSQSNTSADLANVDSFVGILATDAEAIATTRGITTNTAASNTNQGQAQASREQSGGISDSGAIDSSLFEQISLWAVEQGLLLPRDQREDYQEEEVDECDDETANCERVLSQALADPGQVAVIGGCCRA